MRCCGAYVVGKHANDVPRKWTFSRALEEFSRSQLPQRVHAALMERA
jgi:hypothetical protein